jgi:hypothetical protein
MTTSIASHDQWPTVAPENAAPPDPAIGVRAKPEGGIRPLRSGFGVLDDLALLLLIALVFPVLVLLAGMPVVLLVRLVMTIAQLR